MPINLTTITLALRPWSLPASVSPVIVGTAMAFSDGKMNWLAAILALMAAVFIHLGTNVVNDIGDFRSGVDAANPGGTWNVIENKLVSEDAMRCIAFFCFVAAVLCGLGAVIMQEAWILIPVGAVCMLAGIWYTAGPGPAGYLGLGELLVLVFFGPVSVAGTYYLQRGEVTWPTFLAGLACGLICSGILIINNYRDYDGDKKIGKRTLAVRFGRRFAQWEYLCVMAAASLMPVIIFLLTGRVWVLISCLMILFAVRPIRIVLSTTDSRQLSRMVAFTGEILVIFSVLFSIGWMLS